ncbi:PP2C family protein-serine/threonine phosphatase [Methylocystis heyeri]|uniref:Serine/threonine-protein phosphatase n=1 Tax=Methylocystis heyeri TaxID=391905 RepID=A0A6B8KI14_9HYPH|nr:protein phosphatase 2C domain-containing protein [Methylocystis heyeri]QGM47262.1 serine/threonine-protein phosphatase [Methylocystis heyeri]
MTGSNAFWIGSATHVGKARTRNEDRFMTSAQSGIFAVADGMGGHEAGDVASSIIVEALSTIAPQPDSASLLKACNSRLIEANDRIRTFSARRGGAIMGSTVVALAIWDNRYACLWAGDSRAYLSRGKSLRQLTRDHTEVEELLEQNLLTAEEARVWPRRNVITRALGVADHLSLELACGEAQPGDAFLLCSDGLTLHVEPDELQSEIETRGPQRACDELIDLALARGGLDNVTAIVVRYQADEETTIVPAGGRRSR